MHVRSQYGACSLRNELGIDGIPKGTLTVGMHNRMRLTPADALRILNAMERTPRVANDILVECSAAGEREAVTEKALELLRLGVVKRVIIDVRAGVGQVAILFHDP